jgi:hypothetical protein
MLGRVSVKLDLASKIEPAEGSHFPRLPRYTSPEAERRIRSN